ncbi:hypothetical protein SELMODRAFT_411077 [Selaginella moellendorffii]|uniref:Uncharacterized protein n=1 Tax=Selaginella moellendorffii TaxID=88036 RepID=D8RGI4_SELML|nr:hypothetical protein SELMODRAFT_411077 [Selaginella moellendorffii]
MAMDLRWEWKAPRCLGGLNPSELSIRLHPDKGDVFHPLSLNYTTGLACRTWDELVQELSCIYSDAIASLPDASLPDAKTRQNAAIVQGIQPPKDERELAWMSKLSEICRGRIHVDLLLCHKFMHHLDVNIGIVALTKNSFGQIPEKNPVLWILAFARMGILTRPFTRSCTRPLSAG